MPIDFQPRRLILTILSVLIASALLAVEAAHAAVAKRVALVVGNAKYQHATPLANPEHDARAVAAKLRSLGIVVVEGYNLDYGQLRRTVQDFSKLVQNADMGLFYYAGHGIQAAGQNYVIPVDARLADESALDFEAVKVDLVMRQMSRNTGVRIMVLDACRDNPLADTLKRSMGTSSRSASIGRGLAEVQIDDAGQGTAIIFATSPNAVALDGSTNHSPFTAAFLKHVDAPNTDLQVVMSRITGDVVAATKQSQRPWINASLTGEVFLNPQQTVALTPEPAVPPVPAPAVAQPTVSDLQRETALYNLARDSQNKRDFEAYLETFPNGLYAANARREIERLGKVKPVQTAAVSPNAQLTANSVSRATIDPAAEPSVNFVAPGTKSMISDAASERALGLTRNQRREVQMRLNITGNNVGRADGAIGRNTRKGLRGWQAAQGLPQTGYLNRPQLDLLISQTESQLAEHKAKLEAQRAAAAAAAQARRAQQRSVRRNSAQRRNVRRNTASRRNVRRSRNNRGSASARRRAAVVGAFVGGVIGGALRRR